MFAKLYVDRAEKAIKAAIPEPSLLMKKIPFWKLTTHSWSYNEFSKQAKALTGDMISQYQWVKEKMEHLNEEIYHANQNGKKDQAKQLVKDLVLYENQAKGFDLLVPYVKSVQSNTKAFKKADECPQEFETAVCSILYFSQFYTLPSFERFKLQISFRFGEKFVRKSIEKHLHVDEAIVECFQSRAASGDVKSRSKELVHDSKKRAKEEAKMIAQDTQEFKESFVDMGASVANIGTAIKSSMQTTKKSKKSKKSKKNEKKTKKSKKTKKVESSSESEESESEESSSEEEAISEGSDSEESESESETTSESESSESESSDSHKHNKKSSKKVKKEKKAKKVKKVKEADKPELNTAEPTEPAEPAAEPVPKGDVQTPPVTDIKKAVPAEDKQQDDEP